MKKKHLKYLVCSECKGDLLVLKITNEIKNNIKTGILKCSKCNEKYNIINFIPRFVPIENYASSFGLEWTLHRKTQYDDYSGNNISERRFFEETKWSRKLNGEIILEVGSGSGRFTEQASSTGAMVISIDYSNAVEANYASNGSKDNVLIVQGDIYKMPFRYNFFDKLFCIGVLQHTPNVEKSFMILSQYLKSEGNLVIDVYAKYSGIKGLFKRALTTKYWVRPITKNIPPKKLYEICKRYVELMWPIAKIIHKIPRLGKSINWMLLIADYRGRYNLSETILKEWAILDTFDMLSPTYDFPQFIETVRQWFKNANLHNVDIHYGFNGIVGRGTKC